MQTSSGFSDDDDSAPLIQLKALHDDAKFDITAMIALVFMMNIFFLVTMVTAALEEVDLPVTKHAVPADRDESVLVTILADSNTTNTKVFLGDRDSGVPLNDGNEEELRIREALNSGVNSGKHTLLIKAEKAVHLREIARVGRLAATVPGMQLKLSVIEED